MLFDNLTVLHGSLSAAGALVGAAANGAGNVLSANSLDMASLALGGNQPADNGAGEPIKLVIAILAAPTGGTSVQYQLIQADDAALSSNVQVINQTDAIAIVNLAAGKRVVITWDIAAPYAPKRYIGLRFVNVGAIASTSYFAGLVADHQLPFAGHSGLYRGGFTVI